MRTVAVRDLVPGDMWLFVEAKKLVVVLEAEETRWPSDFDNVISLKWAEFIKGKETKVHSGSYYRAKVFGRGGVRVGRRSKQVR
jgi:hypothetical protein